MQYGELLSHGPYNHVTCLRNNDNDNDDDEQINTTCKWLQVMHNSVAIDSPEELCMWSRLEVEEETTE